MKLLALDISTKTGFAVYHDGELVESGTLWPEKLLDQFRKEVRRYPLDYLAFCTYCAGLIYKKFSQVSPDLLAIEETTASNNNLSQKQLEFIHCLFLSTLVGEGSEVPIAYVRDGVWKRMTGALQSDDERKWNVKISQLKKKVGKGKRVKVDLIDVSKFKRTKIEKNCAYAFDGKDYYIRAANEFFSMKLTKKDENEAAAALIGLALLRGAPICDGTTFGGLLPKENEKK